MTVAHIGVPQQVASRDGSCRVVHVVFLMRGPEFNGPVIQDLGVGETELDMEYDQEVLRVRGRLNLYAFVEPGAGALICDSCDLSRKGSVDWNRVLITIVE